MPLTAAMHHPHPHYPQFPANITGMGATQTLATGMAQSAGAGCPTTTTTAAEAAAAQQASGVASLSQPPVMNLSMAMSMGLAIPGMYSNNITKKVRCELHLQPKVEEQTELQMKYHIKHCQH